MSTGTHERRSAPQPSSSQGRVLVAKLGLDGHDVGAKFVSRLLRDNGYEVVYLGIRNTAEAVARAVVDEDVDVVGLSMLSGSHLALVTRVFALLEAEDDDIPPVVVGGVIPTEDHEPLKAMGVRAVFTAGTPVADMIEVIADLVAERRRTGLQ
ncbi:MAG: methylmalonyl-CoA mutase [Propionibacteriales bacterium]|nr:methylmalonyl-CoA mutase [Propionibacteriales bacterium]